MTKYINDLYEEYIIHKNYGYVRIFLNRKEKYFSKLIAEGEKRTYWNTEGFSCKGHFNPSNNFVVTQTHWKL